MKKKLSILIALFVFLSFLNIDVYAQSAYENTSIIKVKLNDKLLEFDVDPIIVNGRTMVPMRAIFEQLGAQVNWKASIKTVTGYRRYKNVSDMFIKLKIGDTTAYRNGKSFLLDSPPIIRNDRTLVPIRFIAESFGIKVDWDSKNRTVLLSYDTDEFQGIKLIDDISYKPRFFENGLKIMIPEFWNESNSSNKFSYKDEETNIQMTIDITQLEKSKTLDQFTTESKSSILNEYKNKVVFTGSDKITVNNIDVNAVYLKNSSITPEVNQVIYYFTSLGYGYKITFSYYSKFNDSQLLNIISNIINTIEISGITFNINNEHYIEYNAFFDFGIDLDSEIYSNIEVENKLSFKGTVRENIDLEYFVAVISKGDKKAEYKIPISNHKFDSQIYTPFGLGKHNITIKTNVLEDNSSQKIMQFSVVNTSNQNITYLIPSLFVEKDDSEIVALANDITKDINKKYLEESNKSEAIFKWIFENIEYDTKTTSSTLKSAKAVLKDKKGNSQEMSYLFAALLRASGIQSKLVKGTNSTGSHIWNEIMINGKWFIVDVTWGSGYIDGQVITKKLDMSYFKADRNSYENKFNEISALEY